ncbi:uncharacterized protein DNG_02998 [Cephalotrichum gorgonifer]|uniref:Gamma interferon inducible lysosomal thiol reductase n=1 Tax=Cephalotrichum gorgonifer TaxID=2041049 RepID=A0AAE8ST59_9PEZI|nr:uncharacterized protein DNG_02998 [Cephalotrichum gorgonifer]
MYPDEKRRAPSYPSPVSPRMRRSTRPLLAAGLALLVIGFFSLWRWEPSTLRRGVQGLQDLAAIRMPDANPKASSKLVPLEAHIMSKCPDAKDCLREMILPAMQKVHDKVDFTLSFIGTPTNDGVKCMHGPQECTGNIIELCAFELYPDPKISLGFTMCLTRDYPRIPARDLVEDCALEHAMDIKALNDCAIKDNGAYGVDILRKSVLRPASRRAARSA